MLETIGSPILVSFFIGFIAVALAIDLFLVNRHSHEPSFKEGAIWSIVWVGLALSFFGWMYINFGSEPALEFLTGYLIELSLSVDNLFIFVLIFSYFSVPRPYQRRVLTYGIVGAMIMRAVFILLGSSLLQHFYWLIYVMGGILIVSGYKLFTSDDDTQFSPEKSLAFRTFKRLFKSTNDYRGDRFFVVEDGRRLATPLFFVLVVVETTDLIFAVDSIPAIFGVTLDPFIVFTSNVFAIIGLRSLYQLIASAFLKLEYLNEGLAIVLCYIGAEMLLSHYVKIPIHFSLFIVTLVIGGSIVISLLRGPRNGGNPPSTAG